MTDGRSDVNALARSLVRRLSERRERLACVESCTGGLVAATIAQVPGASAVLYGGWVVYRNEAKTELLGLDADSLARHSAVSRHTTVALAQHGLDRSGCRWCTAVTCFAGPEADLGRAVGEGYIAVVGQDGTEHVQELAMAPELGRQEIRQQVVRHVLQLLAQSTGAAIL